MSADHPQQQEWMKWLYGECDAGLDQMMGAHLEQCESCRNQVGEWRRVMAILNVGEDASASVPECSPEHSLPTRDRERQAYGFAPRQAALLVASIVLAALGGAWSVTLFHSSAEAGQQAVSEIRSELQWYIKQEMARAAASEDRLLPLIQDASGRIVAAELADWEQQDSQRSQQLRQVLREVLRNQLTLREDLETLAMEAEAQILQTQRELVRVSVDAGIRSGGALPLRPDAEQF